MLGVAAVLATASLPAVAEPPPPPPLVVCLSRAENGPAVPGLEPEAVRAALVLEGRKRGRPVRVAAPADPAGCPTHAPAEPPPVLLSLATPIACTAGADPERQLILDLRSSEPIDRAAELARTVFAWAAGDSSREPFEPLLLPDDDLSRPLPVAEPAPILATAPSPPARATVPLGLLATVGGGYAFEAGPHTHRGVFEGEAALSVFRGVLSIGAGFALAPERSVGRAERPASTRAVEVAGFVRGGLPVGPVLLRLGLGGGYQWRTYEVRPATRFRPVSARFGAAALAIECDVLWSVTRWLVVGLAVPVRVYWGGVDQLWQDEVLYRAPRASLGLTGRVGVHF